MVIKAQTSLYQMTSILKQCNRTSRLLSPPSHAKQLSHHCPFCVQRPKSIRNTLTLLQNDEQIQFTAKSFSQLLN